MGCSLKFHAKISSDCINLYFNKEIITLMKIYGYIFMVVFEVSDTIGGSNFKSPDTFAPALILMDA